MSAPGPHNLLTPRNNPASAMELRILEAVVQDCPTVKARIPYLAKICQIVDQDSPAETRARAHARLADAYYKTQQFIQCEASLTYAVKLFEKSDNSNDELDQAYAQLRDCYDALGKRQLAEHIETRRQKRLESWERKKKIFFLVVKRCEGAQNRAATSLSASCKYFFTYTF